MRVGWLADNPGYVGGAELTHAEFAQAAPDGVEIVSCPPAGIVSGLDRYVAHNVTSYRLRDLGEIDAPFFWFHHDLSPHVDPPLRAWLHENAEHIFCSEMHRRRYGFKGGHLIPPPLDLDSFKAPRQSRKRRSGACSISSWRTPSKGGNLVSEWSAKNGPIDVFGPGRFTPSGPEVNVLGPVAPDQVARTLWGYDTFVFLPVAPEPFGRCVAEAHAAGLKIVTNKLVGALEWLGKPGLRTAAEDFWALVLGDDVNALAVELEQAA